MRVVLDTNVLLSALLSPHDSPDAIYRAWRAARFEIVTSTAQLDELRRASRYPKFKAVVQPHRVGAMVNNLQRALVLDRLPTDMEADDPFDAFLLAMTITDDADYLVDPAEFIRPRQATTAYGARFGAATFGPTPSLLSVPSLRAASRRGTRSPPRERKKARPTTKHQLICIEIR